MKLGSIKYETAISLFASFFLLSLGLSGIFGWMMHNPAFVQFIDDSAPLHFNSALNFALLGVVFYFIATERVIAAGFLAVIPFVVAALTAAQYMLNIDIGIDQLIAKDFITSSNHFPGRMSPNSLVCGILLSAAAIINSMTVRTDNVRLKSSILIGLGSTVFALGMTAALGYLSGISTTYSWGTLIHMPIQSAVGFAISGKCLTLYSWLKDRDLKSTALQSIALPVISSMVAFTFALTLALDTENDTDSFLPVVTFAFGVIISVLAGIMAHLAMAAQLREQKIVEAHHKLSLEVAERVKAEEDLKTAVEQSQQANKLKSRFVAIVSHEMRAPLVSLIGYSDLLKSNVAHAELVQKYSDIISRHGKALLKLVGDILDLSKIEAGKLEVDYREIDLKNLLIEIQELMSKPILDKGIEFEIRTTPPIPDRFLGDVFRLKQILVNLIGNATKFTTKGKIILQVSAEMSGKKDEIEFMVTDTGPGISDADALFQPFSQLKGNAAHLGTGLGLNLSRQLAQALGGELKIRWTKLDEGSALSLVIPCQLSANGKLVSDLEIAHDPFFHADVESKMSDMVSDLILSGARILLVDDAPDLLYLNKYWLESVGAQVQTAESGHEVFEKCSHAQFDIIVLDIQLPDVEGYEVVRRLRQQHIEIPVIAYTANAISTEYDHCLSEGFTNYLAKTADYTQLIEMIAHYYSSRFTPKSNAVAMTSTNRSGATAL